MGVVRTYTRIVSQILLQNELTNADEPSVYSWGVWGNEKGQEICTSWTGLLKDELIITPLPRPPEHLFNVRHFM